MITKLSSLYSMICFPYLQSELSKTRFYPPLPRQQIIIIGCYYVHLQIVSVGLKENIRFKQKTPLAFLQLNLLLENKYAIHINAHT